MSAGFSWRWAFVGQAIAFGGTALLCLAYGGRSREPRGNSRSSSEVDWVKMGEGGSGVIGAHVERLADFSIQAV